MNTKKVEIPEDIWEKVKAEYISTDTSYRQLEKKYGISYGKIQAKAKRGKWLDERAIFKSERTNKSLDLICTQQAEEIAKAIQVGNKLLDKLEQAVDELDVILVKRTKSVKTIEKVDGHVAEVNRSEESYEKQDAKMVDYDKLKQLTIALKNLKEIGIFRAGLDEREQLARIKKLEKESAEESTDTSIVISIEGELNDYAD